MSNPITFMLSLVPGRKKNRRVNGFESKNNTVHMCRFLKGMRMIYEIDF